LDDGVEPVYQDVVCIDRENNTFPDDGGKLGNLTGIFEDKKFRYVELTLNGCRTDCENSTIVDDLIANGEIAIMWYNVAIQDVLGVDPRLIPSREWKSYRFKFATGLVVSKDLYLTKQSVIHHSAWPLGEDDVSVAFRETKQIDTFTTYSASRRRYFKVIFRMDEKMIQEEWTAVLFFDLIGSWGAFWSSLLLLIGTVGLLYNSKKWEFLVSEDKLGVEESDQTVFSMLSKKLGRTSVGDDDAPPDGMQRKKSIADILKMSRQVKRSQETEGDEEMAPVPLRSGDIVDLP